MRIIRNTFLLVVALTLIGCGNATSIWRTEGFSQGVQVASLDAKQRLFITKAKEYCAEPSPDALSALSSSFGIGASIPEQAAVSLANALSEGAASIGLRTQSIQLLRDMLYRVCEAARNGDLNPIMVAQLHARYQNVMIGLLAIEQLTGAVQARQVVLGGEAGSAALAGTLIGVTKRLEEAEAWEATMKKKRDQAQKDGELLESDENTEGSVKQAEAEFNKADELWKTQKMKVEGLEMTCSGNPTASGCDSLEAERASEKKLKTERDEKSAALDKKNKELTEAKAHLKRTESQYKTAMTNRDLIEQMKGQATSNASAAASATGQFETGVSYTPINKDVAEQVKDAVKEIVVTIVTTDHRIDSCLVFLSYIKQIETETAIIENRLSGPLNLENLVPLTKQKRKLDTTLEESQSVATWCRDLLKELPPNKKS